MAVDRQESAFLPLLEPEPAQVAAARVGLPENLANVNLFRCLLHHEEVARIVGNIVGTLVMHSVLDARTREVAILRVGWRIGSVYEWSNHVRIARQAGLSDDEIVAIRGEGGDHLLTEADKCAIAVIDEALSGVVVSPSTIDKARSLLGDDRAVLELLMIPGCYRAIGTVLLSAGVPLEPHVERWPPDGRAAPGPGI